MKIDNKRLYKGDIYHEYEDCSILKYKEVILVMFDHKYVPIWYIGNTFQYIGLQSYTKRNPNFTRCPGEKFLETDPKYSDNGFVSVKNLQPLIKEEGKTSLKELKKLETETRERLGIEIEF